MGVDAVAYSGVANQGILPIHPKKETPGISHLGEVTKLSFYSRTSYTVALLFLYMF